MLNATITLHPLEHRGESQVRLAFPFDGVVKEHIKQLSTVRWLQTHRCFYMPHSSELTGELMRRTVKPLGVGYTLQHSYATHLLQSGTDLRYIQEILGHTTPKTTILYTHVAANDLKKIRSPFDEPEL